MLFLPYLNYVDSTYNFLKLRMDIWHMRTSSLLIIKFCFNGKL